MGLRARKTIRLAKGVNLNLNKGSVGLSVGGKYGRVSVNSKGRTTTTVRTPIKGVSYVESHTAKKTTSQKSNNSPKRIASPKTYKICGWIGVIVGILATLLGLLTFAVGGFVILIIGIFLLILGFSYIKISKSLPDKINELLNWQKIVLTDSPDRLIMTQEQLQQLSEQQASDDLRIIQECMKIISYTIEPDVFFSRLDLLKEKASHMKSLEPFVDFSGATPTAALNEVLEKEQECIYQFLVRCYSCTFDKANTMKTEKGKNNQFKKLYDSLIPYFERMDEQNINYIKHKVEDYI